MFLDLNKIGLEGHAFDHVLELPDLEGTAGERISILKTRLTGEVGKGKSGFDFSAHLDTAVNVDCSRCLEPFTVPIARDFFLILVAERSDAEAATEYDEDEEASLFSCPDGRADLVQMVSEQIYLDLPLKPICREGCKGLCPACGANRNVADCGCPSEAVGLRLAPLLQFKNRQEM